MRVSHAAGLRDVLSVEKTSSPGQVEEELRQESGAAAEKLLQEELQVSLSHYLMFQRQSTLCELNDL